MILNQFFRLTPTQKFTNSCNFSDNLSGKKYLVETHYKKNIKIKQNRKILQISGTSTNNLTDTFLKT